MGEQVTSGECVPGWPFCKAASGRFSSRRGGVGADARTKQCRAQAATTTRQNRGSVVAIVGVSR